MSKVFFCKHILSVSFLLFLINGSSFSQNLFVGNEKIDAVFANTRKIILALDSQNDEKKVLDGIYLFDDVLTIHESRTDDYYALVKKGSQLKLILAEKIKSLQTRPETRPKDPFETTEQYKQRQSFIENQIQEEYYQDIAPLEGETEALFNRYYRSAEASSLVFLLEDVLYNADKSVWDVKASYGNISTSLMVQVSPVLAKAIWDNRSLITIQDITDAFGNVRFVEIAISHLNWRIYLEYDFVQADQSISAFSASNDDTLEEGIAFGKVEIEAQFPGGDAAWARFVQRELDKRIDQLTEDGRSGTCDVQFIIDNQGNVSNVKAITMRGTKLAEVVVNIISKGPKWVPAIQNGRQVKALRRQSVTFHLPDE